MKSEFFKREISLIENERLRNFTEWYFENRVGDWFWQSGASSSGKYHPQFSQGEGGLVRHTRAVAMFCEELLRLSTYAYMKPIYKDFARVACLLHDTCKYGTGNEVDKTCYPIHGQLAADAVNKAWFDYYKESAPELLLMAIRSHMGQWTQEREDRPFTNIDRLVHLADYIASRPFIQIPQIVDDYWTDTEADLPF